jgi:hypothetical protein
VLAQFGSIYYDGCWAYTGGSEVEIDAGNGDLLSMVDSYGTVTAQAVALNPALSDLAFKVECMAPGIVF